tara:strand:- start:356 stop:502 length:147 start_codon:yes stop_codon:yes gene_type:complete
MTARFIQVQPQVKPKPKKEKERVMTKPGSYSSKELEESKKLNLKGGRY